MVDFNQWTQKITDELLFTHKFSIKADAPSAECVERIEDLARLTQRKRQGYVTYINSIGHNHYRVLLHTRRFPANAHTAELRGDLITDRNNQTILRGKVHFGQTYYLGALTGLLFAILVGLLTYEIRMDTLAVMRTSLTSSLDALRDTMLVVLILGLLPIIMLIRVYVDRNRLLKTLDNVLHS